MKNDTSRKDRRTTLKNSSSTPVSEAQTLTRTDEATLDAGKQLLIESIAVVRDFGKTMITTSSSFAVLHLTVLNFLKIPIGGLSPGLKILILFPSGLFLISAAFAIMVFIPATDRFSLDILEEIETIRDRWLRRRKRMMLFCSSFFLMGLVFLIITMSVLVWRVRI